MKLLSWCFVIGVIMILIGHYEWKLATIRPKVIYKFIDETEEEQQARDQASLLEKFGFIFQDQSLLTL